MRETLSDASDLEKSIRITPAYAGNTAPGPSIFDGGKDHPRVCGKHWVCDKNGIRGYRITPAYAGNTNF